MFKSIAGFLTSIFSRLRPSKGDAAVKAAPTPVRVDHPVVVAEVVAEAPYVSFAEVSREIGARSGAIQRRFEAAVQDRLGADFGAGRPVVNKGSLELIVPVVTTLAMTAAQYGSIRQGLAYLGDDLAAILQIELGRAGAGDQLVDGYWRAPPNWQPAPAAEAGADPEPDKSDTTLALWLVGAGAFLTATLGVIGASEADVDRLKVNHPELFAAAVAGLVLAILTGVYWPVLTGRARGSLKLILGLAVVLVGVSTVLIASAATSDLSAKARPRVTAKIERAGERTRLVGAVTATGLQTKEHILVRIVGLSPRRAADGKEIRLPIYNGRTGPDVEGNVNIALDSAVPTGVYERLDVEALLQEDDAEPATKEPACEISTREFGCVSLATPRESRRPHITASWKAGSGLIDIKARMTGLGADDRVLLTVRRRDDKEWGRRLYAASWAPDSLGVVEESFQLEADPSRGSICVIMRALRGTYGRGSEELLRRGPCQVRSRGTAVFLGTPERAG